MSTPGPEPRERLAHDRDRDVAVPTWLAMVATVALLLVGCGGGSPQSALDDYATAVEGNDPERAYGLLTETYRERVSYEKFEERFEKQREANGARIVETLQDASGESAFVDATLPYNEFDALAMTLTRDGWRIEEGLFNFYGQRTPRESLHSFIKAVERRKYDVLLRFVPSAYASSMTAETVQQQFEQNPETIQEMVELLRQNKDNLIRSQGSRAWMEYGPYTIEFLKEDGLWKVEDPD